LVEELRRLKSQRSPREPRVAKAAQILEQTHSSRVRNAAALALADLRAHSAKDALINLLTRPDTQGSRGTLLYALEQLGADVPLPILADIIANDSYEAREEALAAIAGDRIECSAEEFARARARLEAAHASADGEVSEAIRRALEYLRLKMSE
jgi:HEAT repeat protein